MSTRSRDIVRAGVQRQQANACATLRPKHRPAACLGVVSQIRNIRCGRKWTYIDQQHMGVQHVGVVSLHKKCTASYSITPAHLSTHTTTLLCCHAPRLSWKLYEIIPVLHCLSEFHGLRTGDQRRLRILATKKIGGRDLQDATAQRG